MHRGCMAVICNRGHRLVLNMATICYHLPHGPRAGGTRRVQTNGSGHEMYSNYEGDKNKHTHKSDFFKLLLQFTTTIIA